MKLETTVAKQRKPIRVSVPLDTDKVRMLREKRQLNFGEAAAAAGFPSKQRWYEIESGRRKNITLDTLERIARALNVRAKDLLK